MNFFRRPLSTPSARAGLASPQPTVGMPTDRADLSGLEVSDSSWDEWVLVQREVQERRAAVAQGARPQGAVRKGSLQ